MRWSRLFVLAFLLVPGLGAATELPVEAQTAIERAAADGLPTAALEAKAREGVAKGVPSERIAAVLDRVSARLAEADALLADVPAGPDRAELVEAAAEALASKASPKAVSRLATHPAGIRSRALHSLADLVDAGIGEQDAARLVETAARTGQPAVALTGLATAAAGLLASGVPPHEVADHVSSALGQGRSPLAAVPDGKGPKGPPDHSNAGGVETPPGQQR